MASISLRTRFYRAKKMSLAKWEKCAEITEEEFIKREKSLGFGAYDCGFCEYFSSSKIPGDSGDCCRFCPLHDSGFNCCKEFQAASLAELAADYPAYHAAATALRDRIAGMEFEEEE